MENFTPFSALVGGGLIGLAATLLLASSGRIAGISGIFGGLLRAPAGDIAWRMMFVFGLIGGVLIHRLATGDAVVPVFDVGPAMIVLGGFLVGLGTWLGSGCTSGHGVCGIARLSPRSIAATLIFMAAAFVTVFVMRHVLGG